MQSCWQPDIAQYLVHIAMLLSFLVPIVLIIFDKNTFHKAIYVCMLSIVISIHALVFSILTGFKMPLF